MIRSGSLYWRSAGAIRIQKKLVGFKLRIPKLKQPMIVFNPSDLETPISVQNKRPAREKYETTIRRAVRNWQNQRQNQISFFEYLRTAQNIPNIAPKKLKEIKRILRNNPISILPPVLRAIKSGNIARVFQPDPNIAQFLPLDLNRFKTNNSISDDQDLIDFICELLYLIIYNKKNHTAQYRFCRKTGSWIKDKLYFSRFVF